MLILLGGIGGIGGSPFYGKRLRPALRDDSLRHIDRLGATARQTGRGQSPAGTLEEREGDRQELTSMAEAQVNRRPA